MTKSWSEELNKKFITRPGWEKFKKNGTDVRARSISTTREGRDGRHIVVIGHYTYEYIGFTGNPSCIKTIRNWQLSTLISPDFVTFEAAMIDAEKHYPELFPCK